MSSRPSWIPKPPKALTLVFYRSHVRIEDADAGMWMFLCELIPDDRRPYRLRVEEMLNSLSPELKRYYLTRGFDGERGSGGLESCLMNEPGDDHLFLGDTIKAFEALGAFREAAIIRELIPIAQDRWARINEAEARGEEFDFNDGLWTPYEERWDAASEHLNFYDVIWKDIQANPERYIHPK